MTWKDTYYIKVWDDDGDPSVFGWGEAALFSGLSLDSRPGYEEMLARVCVDPASPPDLTLWPSIRAGLEAAMLDLRGGGRRVLYPTPWIGGEEGILINGLIWMGSEEEMAARIAGKVADGFSCIKVKIGGIDFERELELLRHLRSVAPDVELRLDANGAFAPEDALSKLDRLAPLRIHSLEQPIRAGQWTDMARICHDSPIPIALDEELIPLTAGADRRRMLETIRPAYVILKPSLLGGFAQSEQWIWLASEVGAGWWATSALESDIGLNAIAQWCASLRPAMPQGLGTGMLYTNNIPSPLTLHGDRLYSDPTRPWSLPQLRFS